METNGIIWSGGQRIDIKEINKVEEKLGIKFPAELIEIALTNDGGEPDKVALDFGGEKEKVFIGLISISQSQEINIIDDLVSFEDRIPMKIIPFGEDPFGNLYCLDYRSNLLPSVIYWDHELEEEENPFTFVSENVKEFFDSLYQPVEEELIQYQLTIYPKKENLSGAIQSIKRNLGLNTIEAKQLAETENSIMILEANIDDIEKEIEHLKLKKIDYKVEPELI